MSASYRSVADYWQVAGPLLNKHLASARSEEVESFLEDALAIYAYVVEDLDQKHTKNVDLAMKLYAPVLLGFDLLRGAHALQWTLSLAPAVLAARTAFEIFLNLKIITEASQPAVYVDRFFRFERIERLRRHDSGRMPLDPAEVTAIKIACPEWLDKDTNKVDRRIKWHGSKTSLGEMAARVGQRDLYDAIYPTTSAFVHGSSVLRNLYRVGASVQALPEPPRVAKSTLLTALCCMLLISGYSDFYGVAYPTTLHAAWIGRVLTYLEMQPAPPPSTAPVGLEP